MATMNTEPPLSLNDPGFIALSCALSLGIVILTRDGHIAHWNDWMAKRSGISEDAALNQSLYELWPMTAEGRIRFAIEQAITLGQPSLLSSALNKTQFPLYEDPRAEPRVQIRQTIAVSSFLQKEHMCVLQITDVSAAAERENALRIQTQLLKDSLTRIAIVLKQVESQNDQLDFQVRERTAQLNELAKHLQDVSEQEKTKLARELHDDLGSILTAARIDVFSSARAIQTSNPAVFEKLQRAGRYLEEGIQTKRRIIEGMRPTILTQFGLAEALRNIADEMAAVSGWSLKLNLEEDIGLNEDLSLALFRVAQEALTNAAKYAGASEVRVTLEADELFVRLIIGDNGQGMDGTAITKPRSHGLAGMRSRVEARSGVFELLGKPGSGVEVRVTLPLTPATR